MAAGDAAAERRIPAPAAPDPAIAASLAGYALPDGRPLELFAVLAHSPAAFDDLRRATAACLRGTVLTVREREVIVLRTVARAGAEAEWAVHVALFGAAAGLDASELALLAGRDGSRAPGALPGRERLLVRLADALHDTMTVDDGLWAELAEVWEPRALVELLMVAAQYGKVAAMVNVLRVPVPAGLPGFPSPTP